MHFFYPFLARKADVVFHGPGYPGYDTNDVSKIAEKVKPDVVVVADNALPSRPPWTNIEKIGVPKVLHRVEDVHKQRGRRIKYINRSKFDLITSPLITELNPWRPLLKAPIQFITHSVNLDFFKPRYEDREYDVTLRGSCNPQVYPIRHRIRRFLLSSKDIKHGWRNRPPRGHNVRNAQEENEEYAHAIANSKIFIFGVGTYRKALAKFWEGGACKTMIIANEPYDMEAHHLVPGENFVVINKDNFEEKLRYYLEDEEERRRLAENIYQTTVEHHDTEKVVDEFITILEGLR